MTLSEGPQARRILNPAGNDDHYVEVLTAGHPIVQLIKTEILPGCKSPVPVGDKMHGKLTAPIVVGRKISFSDFRRSTSEIAGVQVTNEGVVFLTTHTSVYRLNIEDGRANRVRSLQYLRRGYLDYDEKMPEGFYDGGHSMEFEIGADGKLSANSSREVILLDGVKDAMLLPRLEGARRFIENATTLREKVQMLAMFVSNSLGGSQMIKGGRRDIGDLTDENIDYIKHDLSGVKDVVKLGHLNYGVCRHRALLFKYFADRLGIPSRLVRGQQIADGWHVWNVVQLDGKNYVVDVMQQPWNLIEEGSPELDVYRRAFNEGGRRVLAGIGGKSILAR